MAGMVKYKTFNISALAGTHDATIPQKVFLHGPPLHTSTKNAALFNAALMRHGFAFGIIQWNACHR
jgi:hypothetical protein